MFTSDFGLFTLLLTAGTIDLLEIKEVRLGKNSRDFEKWPDEAKLKETKKCFVIFYGSEFKLRVLSIAGKMQIFLQSPRFMFSLCSFIGRRAEAMGKRPKLSSKRHCNCPLLATSPKLVTTGVLRNGRNQRAVSAHLTPCKPATKLETSRVNLKDLKSFLPRINYKLPTSKLRELFNEVDTRKRAEIGFDDFSVLYQKLMLDEGVSLPTHSAPHHYLFCLSFLPEHCGPIR